MTARKAPVASTAEDILGSRRPKTELIEIGELGRSICFRELTGDGIDEGITWLGNQMARATRGK